jgi:hypothetical protein
MRCFSVHLLTTQLLVALSLPALARAPRGDRALAHAQTAWWSAQGKPRRVRYSSLEQRQLRRMSRIGPLRVDTFFKRVSVSRPDGRGGRWVYALEKLGDETLATRIRYGRLHQPLMIVAEQTFTPGGRRQVFKTWTFRKGDRKLPERFLEATMGLGPGKRDIVSIQHVYDHGRRIGTGISITPGGRDMVIPGILDGGYHRVPRRKTPAEKRVSDLYRARVSGPLAGVQRWDYPDHKTWQRARQQVIEAGRAQVAATLRMTPAAVEAALQDILQR